MKRRAQGFTVVELLIGVVVGVVTLGFVMALLVKSVRCSARVADRMTNVQATVVFRMQLKLDLAAADAGEVKVADSGEEITITRKVGASQHVVRYYTNARHQVFRVEDGQRPTRVGSNLEAALAAVLKDGRLSVHLRGGTDITEKNGADPVELEEQPTKYSLRTTSRFARVYNSVEVAEVEDVKG